MARAFFSILLSAQLVPVTVWFSCSENHLCQVELPQLQKGEGYEELLQQMEEARTRKRQSGDGDGDGGWGWGWGWGWVGGWEGIGLL